MDFVYNPNNYESKDCLYKINYYIYQLVETDRVLSSQLCVVRNKKDLKLYFKKLANTKQALRLKILVDLMKVTHPNILETKAILKVGDMYEGFFFFEVIFDSNNGILL
jgi:hypothetical protein